MITRRRRLLDQALFGVIPLMKGNVLDIGGKKTDKRGLFRPPLDRVKSWRYLNSDADANPDYCCSAELIPLKDNSIDTVIVTEVMQYLPDPGRVLKEINRILSAGGTLLLSTPFLVPVHGDYWADRHRFTALELKEMLMNADFDKIEIEPMGSIGAVINDIIHVCTGYAREGRKTILFSLLRLALRAFGPLFRFLDILTSAQKKHITTGYFITAKKKC